MCDSENGALHNHLDRVQEHHILCRHSSAQEVPPLIVQSAHGITLGEFKALECSAQKQIARFQTSPDTIKRPAFLAEGCNWQNAAIESEAPDVEPSKSAASAMSRVGVQSRCDIMRSEAINIVF